MYSGHFSLFWNGFAQEAGGATMPDGVQGEVGRGAWGYGSVGDIGGRGMVGPNDLGGLFQP